ncbi:pentatricopeptide repeat-containing protein [Senna tora]|uniref:Pentatricopeptide repeat-containing protein n=1 Tax=Senna tora TaxID=362788 RepID=A0A834W0Q1_9FABA|nr:pentatricopeptide repeat-containing protein [Senna tora]
MENEQVAKNVVEGKWNKGLLAFSQRLDSRTRELLTASMSKSFFNTIPRIPCLHMLEGCFSMRGLKQIHAHIITHGLARFAYVASKILAFCAHSELGDLRYAETLFDHLPMPNVFDCNYMIMGFTRDSQFHKSFSIFNRMPIIGIRPNARTFTFVVKACVSLSLLEQVHTQIVKLGDFSDVYVVSSMLSMYSKHGAIEVARRVFDESSHRNVVCWTSLISGYCGNGLVNEARGLFDAIPQRNDVSYSAMVSGYVKNGFFNEAIDLFREFKSCRNLKPNSSLLVSVLNACGAVGTFEEGKWIHSYIDDNGFEYELEIGTALIDFYAKCGCVQAAEHIFSNMPDKDVTAWSAMILGLGINGKNQKALELFAEMEKIGPKPNAVTLVGVLNACNHKFLLKEAWRLFGRMCKVYGISPSIEHYGCMVDILARAGQTKEAEVLINSMPMEPDGAIWGSLLNGCLVHGDNELGLRVGKLLIELDPQHSGRYILLANMYASMSKWDRVSEIRKTMKDRRVTPISAWSFIEIDHTVHKFVVDDKSHSNFGDICRVLSQLGKEIRGSAATAKDTIFT